MCLRGFFVCLQMSGIDLTANISDLNVVVGEYVHHMRLQWKPHRHGYWRGCGADRQRATWWHQRIE